MSAETLKQRSSSLLGQRLRSGADLIRSPYAVFAHLNLPRDEVTTI